MTYKGVLIDQSVANAAAILQYATVVSTTSSGLEGESSRGRMHFHKIEVTKEHLWTVLREVAASIKSPGWYFHLVGEGRLYVVLPRAILLANNDAELAPVIDYAKRNGIHPDQLNLKQLFKNPYA